MPAPQTTFTPTQRIGFEGQIATMYPKGDDCETRIVETVAGIAFGRAVSSGAGRKGCVLGGGASSFLGLSVRDVSLVPLFTQTADIHQYQMNMPVLKRGDIFVKPVAGVSHDSGATFDPTTGVLNPLTGGIAIPGSRYLDDISPGAIGKLRLGEARSFEPINTVAPTISGSATNGSTLTANAQSWYGGPTFTYQWLSDGVAIGGATAATLVLGAGHVGHKISVVVTGTNAYGATTAVSAQTATVT